MFRAKTSSLFLTPFFLQSCRAHGVLFRQRWGAWGIICRCFLGARGGVAALRKPRAPFLFPFPKFQFLTMFVPPQKKNQFSPVRTIRIM